MRGDRSGGRNIGTALADRLPAGLRRLISGRLSEARRAGHQRLNEARRAGHQRLNEARRAGHQRLNEARRAGHQRLNEAGRAGHQRWAVLGGFAVAALVLFVLAPLVLSDFRLGLLGKYLCYAMAAVGIGLAWGRGGMLTLGQGVFFGLGAYLMAFHLKLADAGAGKGARLSWR